jgi:glycine/D-amino acid oxidase-like deaminating enzyme
MNYDFLIIGQGLAGSILAWELKQRGCRVLIVDNAVTSASQVAAGLINPITGMRLVKNQDIDFLLPAAKSYYQNLSCFFKQPFLIEKPMLRIIGSEAEHQYCLKRLNDASYQPYIENHTASPDENYFAPFGILKQKQTSFLQTKPLLADLQKYFIESNCYIKAQFNYQDITQYEQKIMWQKIEVQKIIFCEGYQGQTNPWFSWLPFRPVKGEILTLASTVELPGHLLNYGFWVLPTGKKTFRTGATFDRDHIDTETTSLAKNILLNKLNKIAPSIATDRIIDHQAHIRPATSDKQPFLGCHAKYSRLCIFNGFGAKGSLQIPWYVQRFANYLMTNQSLPEIADIRRFPTGSYYV